MTMTPEAALELALLEYHNATKPEDHQDSSLVDAVVVFSGRSMDDEGNISWEISNYSLPATSYYAAIGLHQHALNVYNSDTTLRMVAEALEGDDDDDE